MSNIMSFAHCRSCSYDEFIEKMEKSGKIVRVTNVPDCPFLAQELEDSIYNDGLRHLNKEESHRYCQQIRESQGFDVENFGSNIFAMGIIVPAPWQKCYDEYKGYVQFAIDAKHRGLQFLKIIKANWQSCCPANFYITFEANDPFDNQIKIYQTKVAKRIPMHQSIVEIFRLKPDQAFKPVGVGDELKKVSHEFNKWSKTTFPSGI